MSRYYDPVTHRFLNADGYFQSGENILDTNMSAYCRNNPVIHVYHNGNLCAKDGAEGAGSPKNRLVKNIIRLIHKITSSVPLTFSSGASFSATPSIWNFNLQAVTSLDTRGNIAIQLTYSSGITSSNPGWSATSYQTITNAPSIERLEGEGYQIGGSFGMPVYGVPLSAGRDFVFIPYQDNNGSYFGLSRTDGFGSPGFEGHGEMSYTWTLGRFNVYSIAEMLLTSILED